MKSVLLVDASSAYLDSLRSELRNAYNVFSASDEKSALSIVESHAIDLCVLDFYLDSSDGRSLFLEIRRRYPQIPCILATARADKKLAIEALNLGVDAMLEKPFPIEDLRARIAKFLPSTGSFSDLLLNDETFSVHLRGKRIILTPIEFQILRLLWLRRNQLVKRDEICRKLWGKMKVTDHTFDTHFSNVKRKIPELREQIQVVRGKGYVLRS